MAIAMNDRDGMESILEALWGDVGRSGEYRLALAVLADCVAQLGKRQRGWEKELPWLEGRTGEMRFETVCETLDVNPGKVAKAIQKRLLAELTASLIVNNYGDAQGKAEDERTKRHLEGLLKPKLRRVAVRSHVIPFLSLP